MLKHRRLWLKDIVKIQKDVKYIIFLLYAKCDKLFPFLNKMYLLKPIRPKSKMKTLTRQAVGQYYLNHCGHHEKCLLVIVLTCVLLSNLVTQ